MNILVRFLPVLLNVIAALTTKQGYKSKTVLLGAILMLLAGLQAILPDLTPLLGAYGPIVSAGIGFAVIALRTVTDTPLESNKEDTSDK
jgi:hypothetical protein